MKIILAPDKFKGSLSAIEFCKAAAKGLLKSNPGIEIISLPMSDGGDGFLDVICYYAQFIQVPVWAKDPLGRSLKTNYLISEDKTTAYIELAKISGLVLLNPYERNCNVTSSYGFGELIRHALLQGVSTIYLSLGGSATNDAGTGMARALGFSFFDGEGVKTRGVGEDLVKIHSINDEEVNPMLNNCKFIILTDVNNPLTGKNGAVQVYARQKGANEKDLATLEKGMHNIAEKMKKRSGVDITKIPGSGAAGGIGAGAMFFLNASVINGSEFVLNLSDFERHLDNANLIITGEGKLDSQSAFGKIPWNVARKGKENGIPVLAIAGSISEDASFEGIDECHSILKMADNLKDAMDHAANYIEKITENIKLSKFHSNGKS
jgi:glycerate kinase